MKIGNKSIPIHLYGVVSTDTASVAANRVVNLRSFEGEPVNCFYGYGWTASGLGWVSIGQAYNLDVPFNYKPQLYRMFKKV